MNIALVLGVFSQTFSLLLYLFKLYLPTVIKNDEDDDDDERCRSGFKTAEQSGASESDPPPWRPAAPSLRRPVPFQTSKSERRPSPEFHLHNNHQSTAAPPTGPQPMGADFIHHIGHPWSLHSPSLRGPRRRPRPPTCPSLPPWLDLVPQRRN